MAIAPNCNSTELAKGHYACTKSTYAAALDSAIAHQVAGDSQHSQRQAGFYPGLSREGQVTYFPNLTDSQTGFLWNANRQVLEEFSYWLEHYIPDRVHDSINALVHRMGPTTGVYSYCLIGNISVIPADGGDIHCLVTNTTTHSCTRKLRGRNPIDMRSQFSIQDLKSSNGNVSVEAFSVTNTAYCIQTLAQPCIQIPQKAKLTNLVTGIRYSPKPTLTQHFPIGTYWFWNMMFLTIPSLSQINIELGGVKPGNETSVVHPDWVLAGWSVDRNDTVDGERYAARELVTSLKNALQQSKSGKEETDKRKHLSLIRLLVLPQGKMVMPQGRNGNATGSS
ncbi:MAG: hypothetical protein M1813_001619 [Trichoglossum hirsutum]|nr:MAG: hypothetical protein M1813_001619 [Trichoglossum hirsutum]